MIPISGLFSIPASGTSSGYDSNFMGRKVSSNIFAAKAADSFMLFWPLPHQGAKMMTRTRRPPYKARRSESTGSRFIHSRCVK